MRSKPPRVHAQTQEQGQEHEHEHEHEQEYRCVAFLARPGLSDARPVGGEGGDLLCGALPHRPGDGAEIHSKPAVHRFHLRDRHRKPRRPPAFRQPGPVLRGTPCAPCVCILPHHPDPPLHFQAEPPDVPRTEAHQTRGERRDPPGGARKSKDRPQRPHVRAAAERLGRSGGGGRGGSQAQRAG